MAQDTYAPTKSLAVQLDEAIQAVAGFKSKLTAAEAAKNKAEADFDASKQKVRDLHEKFMAQLGDIIPQPSVNHRP